MKKSSFLIGLASHSHPLRYGVVCRVSSDFVQVARVGAEIGFASVFMRDVGHAGRLQPVDKFGIARTAALTGLRASELRGLRWRDVDLKAGELTVRQRADYWLKIGPPKSASSRRTIPLDPAVLMPALKTWKMACPPTEADLVFPTSRGTVAYHANLLRSLDPVMEAAGVVDAEGKPKYALHSFRHFFASWCINPKDRGGRELPPKVVQSLLGHSSIVMTLDVYGHLFPRGDDRAELAAAAKALLT
jgi:integrase